VADALVNGKAIRVEGGNYRVYEEEQRGHRGMRHRHGHWGGED
jgi:hypothetical protein